MILALLAAAPRATHLAAWELGGDTCFIIGTRALVIVGAGESVLGSKSAEREGCKFLQGIIALANNLLAAAPLAVVLEKLLAGGT